MIMGTVVYTAVSSCLFQLSTSCCVVTRLPASSSTSTPASQSVRDKTGAVQTRLAPGTYFTQGQSVCLVQILMSAGRSPESVPMACASTRSEASAASAPWASATITYFSFVKVKFRLHLYVTVFLFLCFNPCQCIILQLGKITVWPRSSSNVTKIFGLFSSFCFLSLHFKHTHFIVPATQTDTHIHTYIYMLVLFVRTLH